MRETCDKKDIFCLCGSGKSYRECCMSKINPYQDERTYKKFASEMDKKRKRYKHICLHPQQEQCSKQKIHAHTISQKAVLELIAEESKVLMPIVFGVTNEFKMQSMGIEAKATKFYCFCSEHDKMFYPIDKRNVELSKKIEFLYMYRIFASTYYKVQREIDMFNLMKKDYDLTWNPMIFFCTKNMQKNMISLESYKKKFDNAIISGIYNEIESVEVVLGYKVYFAAATCFCPRFDIVGNRIIYQDDKLPLLYISVIPNEKSTRILFSWWEDDNYIYKSLKRQINTIPTRLIMKYLNNLLPINCENMVVSPILWKKWSSTAQEEYLNVSIKHLDNIRNNSISETYFKNRKYNLFLEV